MWLGRHKHSKVSACPCRQSEDEILPPSSLPEHGDEQVDKQDVGDKQINNQQNYHQPVTVHNSAWLLAILNQCHVACALHVPTLPN